MFRIEKPFKLTPVSQIAKDWENPIVGLRDVMVVLQEIPNETGLILNNTFQGVLLSSMTLSFQDQTTVSVGFFIPSEKKHH